MPHPRPTWPRRLRRLCLFLLLGLVTTVGVAWGLVFTTSAASTDCATWVLGITPRLDAERKLHIVSRIAIGTHRRWWAEESFRPPNGAVAAHRGPPPPLLTAYAVGGFFGWGEVNAAIQNYMSRREVTPYLEEARGLPALCLSYGVGAGPESTNGVIDGGYILPTPLHAARDLTSPREFDAMRDRVPVLPLLPIWPGLAFNTFFYALLWYLALASARMVSHNRRYRRGLCSLCRYDLRADYSQGCSECGWQRATRMTPDPDAG